MLKRIEALAARRRLRGRVVTQADLPDPERPAGTESLSQVDHIVILMMENHSYDNYLGMLAGHGDGLPLDDHGMPTSSNPAADGTPVGMRRYRGTVQVKDVPSQSWNASHLQWNHGA